MDFHILTLIPEILKPYFNESILGRAQKEGGIRIFCHQLRDYAANKHQSVDDRPYGGGAGMVFKPDVVVPAVRDIKAKHGLGTLLTTLFGAMLIDESIKPRLFNLCSVANGTHHGEIVDVPARQLTRDELLPLIREALDLVYKV